ncbi:MAG TPA: hypothetical protein VFC51_18960 [Chloroflexota bacterium]|nr:hypothetical protein [Chloroflexota bacterium]
MIRTACPNRVRHAAALTFAALAFACSSPKAVIDPPHPPPAPATPAASPTASAHPGSPSSTATQSTAADQSGGPDAAAVAEEEPTSTAEPTPSPTRAPTAPSPTRTPKPLTAEDAAPCSIGQIKGNVSSKIYHVPTGGSYARTKNKVECFDNESDAQAAGYRRARN